MVGGRYRDRVAKVVEVARCDEAIPAVVARACTQAET